VFSSVAKLQHGAEVLDDDITLQAKVSAWTWSIEFPNAPALVSPEDIMIVLRHAAKLRRCDCSIAFPSLFKVLTMVSTHGLTHLKADVWMSASGLSSWMYLGQLTNLRVLNLIGSDDRDEESDLAHPVALETIPALSLPHLESLSWRSYALTPRVQSIFLTLLSRCVFGRLREFHVMLMADAPASGHGQHLVAFLRAHPHIISVRLEGFVLDPKMLRLVLPVLHATHVSMQYPPSGTDFLSDLTPDVCELVFSITSGWEDRFEELWAILGQLEEGESKNIQRVVFEAINPEYETPLVCTTEAEASDFGFEEENPWLARLIAHAFSLKRKKGISLLDQRYMDITTGSGPQVRYKWLPSLQRG
jgi:hypothetical protein